MTPLSSPSTDSDAMPGGPPPADQSRSDALSTPQPGRVESPARSRPAPGGSALGLTPLGLFGAGIAVVGLLGVVMTLAGMQISRAPTAEAGAANLPHLWSLWITAGVGWAGLTVLWRSLAVAHAASRSAVHQLRDRGFVILIIVSIAILARMAVITLHDTALSDDIHRYEFDGRTLAAGVNPYLHTPRQRMVEIVETREERWPGETMLLLEINNPDLHTIYLPASQYTFAAIGMLMGDTAAHPDDSTQPLRTIFIVFEMFALGILIILLRARKRSPWWAALYAWHPLALIEIAGSGHQDVIGIAFLMLALLLLQMRPARTVLWTIALSLSVLVKPITIPFALFMLRSQPQRTWIACGIVGVLVCLVLSAPLLLTHDRAPLQNLRTTSTIFTEKWAHFGSIYEPVLALSKLVSPIEDESEQWQKREMHERLTRYVCATLLLGIFVLLLLRGTELITAIILLVLAMILLSPTAHPWYALWGLMLLPLVPHAAFWIVSYTLLLGYAALASPADWHVSWWVYAAAYLPVYVALLAQPLLRIRTVQ